MLSKIFLLINIYYQFACFWKQGLYSPSWPQTHYVIKDGLELLAPCLPHKCRDWVQIPHITYCQNFNSYWQLPAEGLYLQLLVRTMEVIFTSQLCRHSGHPNMWVVKMPLTVNKHGPACLRVLLLWTDTMTKATLIRSTFNWGWLRGPEVQSKI